MNLQRLLIRIKNSYLRREIVFAVDIVISLVSSLILIFGIRAMLGNVQFFTPGSIGLYVGVAAVASVGMFLLTRTSRIIIRHLSVRDLNPFMLAVLGKGVALILALAITRLLNKWWVLLVVLDCLLTLFLIVGVRLMMIAMYSRINASQQKQYNKQRLLIYSTNDKSVAAIKRLQLSTHYDVKGFIARGDHPRYTLSSCRYTVSKTTAIWTALSGTVT